MSYRQKTIEGVSSDAILKNGPINWGAQNNQIGKLKMDSQEVSQKRELAMQLNLSNNKLASPNPQKGTSVDTQARSFDINKKGDDSLIQKIAQNEIGTLSQSHTQQRA